MCGVLPVVGHETQVIYVLEHNDCEGCPSIRLLCSEDFVENLWQRAEAKRCCFDPLASTSDFKKRGIACIPLVLGYDNMPC